MSELHVPLPEPDPEDLVRELEREERNITRDLLDAELRRPSIRERIRAELRSRLQPFVAAEDVRAVAVTHKARAAYVLARPQAGVRELARELGVAPSTVTRIRQKHATPSATAAETSIATAAAQSEEMMTAAATTVVDAPSAAEQIAEHQRQLAGPEPLVKGIAPLPQPRLYFIPEPSMGEEPLNVGAYDLSRSRIETGPFSSGRRRRGPTPPMFNTPYNPNNA